MPDEIERPGKGPAGRDGAGAPGEPQSPEDLPPMAPGKAFAIKALGSFFGLGFLPLAPGTWGSLVSLAAWLVMVRVLVPIGTADLVDALALTLAAVFSLATRLLGGPAERAGRAKDPRWFVLDEVAGAFLALYGLAGYNLGWAAGAFLLFRLLDATKLGAIGWADRKFSGGVGILMDDLFAGAAACMTVRGAVWLLVR